VQDDLALEVVANLDLFLVLVGGLVDVVVTLGLEEKMPALAAHHRHQPGDQRGRGGVEKQQHIGRQEGESAEQVQRLVDPAVMVVAVVIPALGTQCIEEAVHEVSLPWR